MNGPADPAPRTIRARIHESAVRRVTRVYAATLGDIFAELLQNARRADAARVRISVERAVLEDIDLTGETHFTVTVADDGEGLLSARLLYAEDLGAARLLHCAVGDGELIVHTPNETRGRPGDTLRLAVDPANLHLFDAESGRRLEAMDDG